MKIELLNVRIFITENSVVTDAIGNHRNDWKEYYSCYATVSSETGKESEAAGLVVDDGRVDLTVRWCRKVDTIDATHFRVQFMDELYDILAVDHMNFKKKCVKLKCQKVRR